MKKLWFVLLILFIGIGVSADDADKDIVLDLGNQEVVWDFDHYIGGTAGLSTGYGLTYRYWPEKLGGQICFAPYWEDKNINLSAGVTGFRTLYETKYTRLFLYLSGSYGYNYNEYDDYAYDEETEESYSRGTIVDQSHNGVIGVGPGFEVFLFKNLAINGMFGYRYSYTYNSNAESTHLVTPTGECGIYYRF